VVKGGLGVADGAVCGQFGERIFEVWRMAKNGFIRHKIAPKSGWELFLSGKLPIFTKILTQRIHEAIF